MSVCVYDRLPLAWPYVRLYSVCQTDHWRWLPYMSFFCLYVILPVYLALRPFVSLSDCLLWLGLFVRLLTWLFAVCTRTYVRGVTVRVCPMQSVCVLFLLYTYTYSIMPIHSVGNSSYMRIHWNYLSEHTKGSSYLLEKCNCERIHAAYMKRGVYLYTFSVNFFSLNSYCK